MISWFWLIPITIAAYAYGFIRSEKATNTKWLIKLARDEKSHHLRWSNPTPKEALEKAVKGDISEIKWWK